MLPPQPGSRLNLGIPYATFASSPAAQIAARPGLAGTPAVKSGRIHPVDRVRVLEGVDPAGAVRYLHELIHRKERK